MTESAARPDRWWTSRFFLVTVAAVVGVTAIIVGLALAYDDGHLVYLTDDPGIHLSVVHELVNHGTWGVVPGQFESASSSPGWTLLLAGPTALLPAGANLYPLLLNLAAGVVLVALFTTNQRLVRRDDRSWSMALLAVVGVFVLYIPALALLGMEHTLQCALVLLAVILLERVQRRALTISAIAPLLGVLLLATAVRFETLFLACGVAVAFVVGDGRAIAEATDHPEPDGHDPGAQPRPVGAAVRAGRRGLPDLGLLRGTSPQHAARGDVPDHRVAARPLRRLRLVRAVPGVPGGPRGLPGVPGRRRDRGDAIRDCDQGHGRRGPGRVVGRALRPDPRGTARASNTYRQRYQLGRFFEAEYAGETVATTELGYASLDHRGPLLDIGGIGSHDVLETIQGPGLDADRFAALLERHDGQVLVLFSVYPVRPKGWKPVGVWTLDERIVDSPGGHGLVFYAPPGAKTDALHDKLRQFESQLPSRVRVLLAKP